ncbi:nitrate reductase molybdenum cofactor assembly chaperone [Nonomuraea gerenzanensis]|uniref:Respiratory nitrate reductase delta chain n=1 Tax=Nonomuraea gerenzanensis TaxID=93944 RepID=A0A1M4EQC9_9ACTN|nr:nitrate reductase molybdenum cofactor assembly chaperone [Nonomuraea gerenzanensis]UBU12268.1 nitrate reductase molybdenum cofactor assembly chaperone [Nonomuraea gerenzanensis]SBP00803.1 Respiratory nitrate reductase delta chain [Nonomuraea gerenzanensis]
MTRPVIWQAAAHLLAYPDERFWRRLPLIRQAAEPHFTAFLALVADLGQGELAGHYVDTFDLQRRCCLYLTYYTDGDTRRRGESLAALKQRYRAAGWELMDDELPDFLPVMLEFAACDPSGAALLQEHRAGLELLLAALTERDSPYRHVIGTVCAALPPLSAADRATAARLAAGGPPAESVGGYR